ncbi:MAG: DUF1801 domain-containing protein [Bacteroidota bacterium]
MDKKKPTAKDVVKKSTALETKPSEPEAVDAFMRQLKHPMLDVLKALREAILSADKEIGEEIKWNAPTFFYAGKMKPSDPKKYKRYIIVSNFFRKDCIRLVFPSGAKLNDTSGLLEGDYADGRRLAVFYSLDDVKKWKKTLQKLIKKWLMLREK